MADKRKIVIVGSAWPLRGGGIATFNERLAKAWLDHGDEVTIYSFSLQYPSLLFPGTTQHSSEPAPEELDIRVKVNSINPLNWLKVGKEIGKLKPDFVLFRFWIPFMAPCLGTIARQIRKAGIKTIAIVDNIIPHEKKFFDRPLAGYFVKSVDYFITMSQSVLEDLNTFDADKPKKYTVHPLYDNFGEAVSRETALERIGLSTEFRYILFFGFIREYKGLDLLLKAIAGDRISKLPVRLVVAGEFYIDRTPYMQLIEDLNIAGKVILKTEFIPNTEVVNYFCLADLVVQPYKTATQSGITQVAYHFNKPMITTNVGGLAEIVKHNEVGFVVNPDSGEIEDAICTFFEKDLAKTFTANIQKEKNRFSWETMLKAIDEVMDSDHSKK
jgi:D-inositol-3-phosphate glycosyltransferase